MKIRGSITIAAPAAQAWTVLGEQFAHIGEWTSAIQTSSLEGELGVGAVRHCQIAAFGPVPAGTILERLLEFDQQRMYFVYDAVGGMPKFIGVALNHWSVERLDDSSCVVHSEANLELTGLTRLFGFLLRAQFERGGVKVLKELKYRVENGVPHPRKQKAQTRAALE